MKLMLMWLGKLLRNHFILSQKDRSSQCFLPKHYLGKYLFNGQSLSCTFFLEKQSSENNSAG